MGNQKIIDPSPLQINSIAGQIFERMALQFPVCMASDEFHFFPQAMATKHDWSRWDDFSSEAIQAITRQLTQWNQDLDRCETAGLSVDQRIDISLLQRMIKTILEQFIHVAAHQSQPTFYLTILSIGITEAIEAGPRAINSRMQGIPEFLDHARDNLQKIPRIFLDLGCEMISGLIIKTTSSEPTLKAMLIKRLKPPGFNRHHGFYLCHKIKIDRKM